MKVTAAMLATSEYAATAPENRSNPAASMSAPCAACASAACSPDWCWLCTAIMKAVAAYGTSMCTPQTRPRRSSTRPSAPLATHRSAWKVCCWSFMERMSSDLPPPAPGSRPRSRRAPPPSPTVKMSRKVRPSADISRLSCACSAARSARNACGEEVREVPSGLAGEEQARAEAAPRAAGAAYAAESTATPSTNPPGARWPSSWCTTLSAP
mmetsp:Transcript_7548/g.30662  ORF Transcript_7548/g.30662 Transcript_7548/m.30662 type:complete len:211 (-) Transcript_7548:267-899(-)